MPKPRSSRSSRGSSPLRVKPLPCPFCGCGARVFQSFDGAWPKIRCNAIVNCGTELRPLWPIRREELIQRWNDLAGRAKRKGGK